MTGKFKAALFVVASLMEFGTVVVEAEGTFTSSSGCENGLIISKMESLEEQQRELVKLNRQIIHSLEGTLTQLSNKLSHLESGNTYRFERMKTELNKQNKQITGLVQSQTPPQTINLDDKFAQQNQLFEQRLVKLEEAIGNRIDNLTEESRSEAQKWNGKIVQECDVLKETIGNISSKLEQTQERSQENCTIGSEMMMSSQSHLNETIQEVVVPQLKRLSDKLEQLESDNKVCIERTVNETLCSSTAKGLNDTESLKLTSPAMTSCSDSRIKRSGRYWIQPLEGEPAFEAYCEHEKHGGGWLVIQERFDGSVDFDRGWDDFKVGFGDLDGEFFVGLETVHRLAAARKHLLLVEVESFNGKKGYAQYDNFKVGSEKEQFSLNEVGSYKGTAGDSLTANKGMRFSTKDRDNDTWEKGDCVANRKGAWWFYYCGYSGLNGPYVNEKTGKSNYWVTLNNQYEGLRKTRMMIKEA